MSFRCEGKSCTAFETLLFRYRSTASAMFKKPVSLYGTARKSAGMLSDQHMLAPCCDSDRTGVDCKVY